MSVAAPRHLLIEACEPLLQPARSRCDLFRQGCRTAGLRDYPDKAMMPGFLAADARFGGLPRPLPTRDDEIGFWTGYYGEVLATMGQTIAPDGLRKLVLGLLSHQSVVIAPVLPPRIDAVRRAGGRVILVADWYASFRQTLINSGLLGLFPEIFLAGQQGVYLEDQNGVMVMLRTLGLRPETSVFLGAPRAAMAEVGLVCYTSEQLDDLPMAV
ncbi:MAG: hypothetical protein H7338_01125 [Candidatus Sericytochromatia bacterium]|nr:hypothetical protein [Candidatus Sericytochromatia bacterium]